MRRAFQPRPESAEYTAWRQQFLLDRLQLGLRIATPIGLILVVSNYAIMFSDIDKFDQDILKLFEDASLGVRMRSVIFANMGAFFTLISMSWSLFYSRWGKQHPAAIFFCFSSFLTWSDMVVCTCFGIPSAPDPRFFFAQSLLIPVRWRWHAITQLVPSIHYALVYPLLGMTKIGSRDFYGVYAIQRSIDLCWMGAISILSVYLYERLKRSDFESQRRLRGAINAISHDLKNPAMGISVVLQGLLLKPDRAITVDRQILTQLLASSDRQIDLIKSILAAQSAEVNAPLLTQLQPLQISEILGEILADLAPIVKQHRMEIIDRVSTDLPAIYGDKTQLGRVFNNLISNVLKHNPNGTQIEISAQVIRDSPSLLRRQTLLLTQTLRYRERDAPRWRSLSLRRTERLRQRHTHYLRCTIRDQGVGIPLQQRPYLFDLYTRGNNAKRMPGLGLGLYLCRQIIIAHQGEIGFNAPGDGGSEFWFTLPIL
jgi:signal transduction histidine kinase